MSAALRYRISKGALSTISPPIPRAYEWASRFKATPNHPLLDMSQGVPGISPPDSVKIALGDASSSNSSFGYSRWDGELGLRSALAEEMKTIYGRDSDLHVDDIALTAGCNLGFVAAAMSIADPGEEIILPVPWYFNHQMALNLLGIKTVPLETSPDSGFQPSVEQCRRLVTPKTRAIVLVTPNNPTGATYPPSLIASFSSLARDNNIALIIDETYRDFIISGNPPHNLFSESNAQPWRSTFIHLFSFSKSYCLPGHRLGAMVASPLLLASVRSVLDTLQICPPRPVQLALAPLLPGLRNFVNDAARSLHARHALFKARLPPRWKIGAQGGYFAFVRHPYSKVRAVDVSRRLAEEIGVVTLPSSFFSEEINPGNESDTLVKWGEIESATDVREDDRWLRFSVANVDDEKVKLVCKRLRVSEDSFDWDVENC